MLHIDISALPPYEASQPHAMRDIIEAMPRTPHTLQRETEDMEFYGTAYIDL